jgi:hypothetical protein
MYSLHVCCQKPRGWEYLRAFIEVKFEKVDEDKNACAAIVKGVSNKMTGISNCCDRVLLKFFLEVFSFWVKRILEHMAVSWNRLNYVCVLLPILECLNSSYELSGRPLLVFLMAL